MRILSEKEFRDNFDYYSDLVFEKKETIQINLENGTSVYLKPANENETR